MPANPPPHHFLNPPPSSAHLHPHSDPEAMNDSSLRLPSIAELVSPPASAPSSSSAPLWPSANHSSDPAWDTLHQASSLDTSVSRSAPLFTAGPLPQPDGSPSSSSSNRSSWTAINHQTQNSSLASSPPESDSNGHPASIPQHFAPNTFTASQSNSRIDSSRFMAHSPQIPRPEMAVTEKPITAWRQDSAVSEPTATRTRASTNPQEPAAISSSSSSYLGINPEKSQISSARGLVPQPTTPPSPVPSPLSDPTSTQLRPAQHPTQTTRHERRRTSPPLPYYRGPVKDVLTRPRSADSAPDSRTSPSIVPNNNTPLSPRRVRFGDDDKMPPPPNPTAVVTSSSKPASLISNTTAGASNHDFGQALDSLSRSVGTPSSSISRLSGTNASPKDFGNPSPQRCLACNEVWAYPLPSTQEIELLVQDRGPAKTIEEMEKGTDIMASILTQHHAKELQAYKQWARYHQVYPGDPECMAVRADASDVTSTNNKRKSDGPVDEGHLTSKIRRLSCKSPSPRPPTQLTPPPEPTSTSPLQHNAASERLHPYGGDAILINDRVATVLGMEGAPAARFEEPPNDASNMWYEPTRGHKREVPLPQPGGNPVTDAQASIVYGSKTPLKDAS